MKKILLLIDDICFYNEVRPHATLKYKIPQALEAAYTNIISKRRVQTAEGE